MNTSQPFTGPFDVFAEWSLYDKVIHFNYMRHREMAAVIHSCALAMDPPRHVLDLGCGDGRLAHDGLREIIVESYVGVDLSKNALDAARDNLAEVSSSVVLRESDLEAALAGHFNPSPNLIMASYSLHHFRRDAMVDLLKKIARSIDPGGVFLWIDLQREESESRDHYLTRFCHEQLTHWSALNESQIQEVIEHMSKADFPLNATEKLQLASDAGFQWRGNAYHDSEYSADLYGTSG